MLAELDSMLSNTVKIVSYVKANVLNSTLFFLLCDDVKNMKAEHKQIYLHVELWWIWKEKLQLRLFEPQKTPLVFLQDKKISFTSTF